MNDENKQAMRETVRDLRETARLVRQIATVVRRTPHGALREVWRGVLREMGL